MLKWSIFIWHIVTLNYFLFLIICFSIVKRQSFSEAFVNSFTWSAFLSLPVGTLARAVGGLISISVTELLWLVLRGESTEFIVLVVMATPSTIVAVFISGGSLSPGLEFDFILFLSSRWRNMLWLLERRISDKRSEWLMEDSRFTAALATNFIDVGLSSSASLESSLEASALTFTGIPPFNSSFIHDGTWNDGIEGNRDYGLGNRGIVDHGTREHCGSVSELWQWQLDWFF